MRNVVKNSSQKVQNYNHKVGKKFSVHKIIHTKAARRSSNGTLKRCLSSLVHSKQLSVHNKVNNLPFFPTFNSRRRFYTSEVQPKKDGVMVRKYFFFETNYAGVPLKYAWFHSNHFFFQRHFLGDVRFKIYQNRSHNRVGRVDSESRLDFWKWVWHDTYLLICWRKWLNCLSLEFIQNGSLSGNRMIASKIIEKIFFLWNFFNFLINNRIKSWENLKTCNDFLRSWVTGTELNFWK